ncbi:MAG: hypothetical protein JXA82_12960 [Sedimentisphaerales bacterium]|nr:hypothetical protein [Sedimentisphaerales bacterium]
MPEIKQEWVKRYANQALDAWRSRESALDISDEYLQQLEADLDIQYENPLIREFIESLWESPAKQCP